MTIERNALLKTLGHVQRVVERRNTYPILANVMIDAGGNGLTMRATDLDIEVTETVSASISAPFATTIPASTFYDIVKKFGDGSEVTLEHQGEGMVVKSGRSRFNLATLAADSFPDLKSGSFTSEFKLPATDLRAMIERTQFAISSEETRYYLNGIYVHYLEPGLLRTVATDGHRMARTEVPAPEGSRGFNGIIIPKKTVNEVAKLIDGMSSDVGVEISDTKIRFTVGEVVLLSKLIEGTFPDYDRVTPKNNDKVLLADRDDLAKMVDRVSTIASDKGGKAVKLTVVGDKLEAVVFNQDHGEASEDMPVEFSFDGAFEIGFNTRYLLDVLGQIPTDQVQFKLNDANSPTLISAPNEPNTIYVLMPMRV
ncbi:MAG: DNA polymerase III subunit beta [Devosia sp.]|nr:DNA polymerase III subunit beta [Devosia sp.]